MKKLIKYSTIIIRSVPDKMIKYLALALCLVFLEMILFVILNSVCKFHYVIATSISFAFVVMLNWYGSRRFVFKSSNSNLKREVYLVFLGSIAGLILQIGIAVFFVEAFRLMPIIGKSIAICCVFFWNYWFRLKYVFG
jgi:putative flippase GtrA